MTDLLTNATISHYRIVSKLGAGGMGEVYRAHDSRLNREVAIKLLPPDFANNSDRLRRFQQEAQATSALNHPNILTVYDVGEHESAPFIVTELLEGEELRERLNQGPIPVRKVTDYAQQIVSGLSAAHERGIVHRDLKPENIFITNDDRVKILDFGLAKLREHESSPTSSEDATRKVLTNPGVVMGTAGYMSPEQVRAQLTDHRSDIFSFGSILYEMITGRRAFHQETLAETMSAILKEEPKELSESNPNVSPALERIVRRCLEKKAERRFQSTSDLGFALESLTAPTISSSTVTEVAAQPTRERPNRRLLFYGLGILLLAIGVLAGILLTTYSRKSSTPVYQQLTFRRGLVNHARFAPDGQTTVYSATWNGNPFEIFSTRPGSTESRSLGLSDADILGVSSTGELAILTKRKLLGQFLFTGTLARVPLNGGAPRDVVENAMEADWSPDGSNLAVTRYVDGRTKLEYPIGKLLYETAGYISYPRISPDGNKVAFVDHENQWDNRGRVALVDLAGKKAFLTEESVGQEGLAWSATGDEVWYTAAKTTEAQVLYGVTLSGKSREILRVPGDIWLHDIARDGRLLLSRLTQGTEIVGLAPGDTKERDLSFLDFGTVDDLSRDGRTFIYEYWGATAGRNYTIYLGKTDGSPAVKLGDGGSGQLSPDGKWVLAVHREPPRLVLLPTGAGVTRQLEKYGIEQYNSVEWLPDGKRFLFVGREPGHLDRCYLQQLDAGEPKAITPEGVPCWLVSPDGTTVVGPDGPHAAIYRVDGVGYPRALPEFGERVTIAGWSSDGKSLYVYPMDGASMKISRFDIATGHREFLKEITLSDPAGVFNTPTIVMTPDAKGYVYTARRFRTDLYLAEGLK
jgi:serine/threonine protein kinase/sugar lactone lactonase YvrE